MDESMETFVPLTFRRRGVRRVAADERSVHDVTLLDGWHAPSTGSTCWTPARCRAGSAIARAEKLHHSVVNELVSANCPAVDWQAQRRIIANFEEDA